MTSNLAMAAVDVVLVDKDDYNAWLGVGKTLYTLDEINNAFRKLSRIFHPDKHFDDEKKEKAEVLFNKIKKAHEG